MPWTRPPIKTSRLEEAIGPCMQSECLHCPRHGCAWQRLVLSAEVSTQQPAFSSPPDGEAEPGGRLCAGILVQRNVFLHTQWLVMGTVRTTCNCSLERALSLIMATCRSVEMVRLLWKCSTSEGFLSGPLQAKNAQKTPPFYTLTLPRKYSFIKHVLLWSVESD